MTYDERIAQEMASVINYLVVAQGIDTHEMEAIECDNFEKALTERLESDYEYFYDGYFDIKIQKLDNSTSYLILIEAETFYETNHQKDISFIESILGTIQTLTLQIRCHTYY